MSWLLCLSIQLLQGDLHSMDGARASRILFPPRPLRPLLLEEIILKYLHNHLEITKLHHFVKL